MSGNRRRELTVPVDVAVPTEVLWAAVTDWERQGDWMLGTRVEVTNGDGRSVGSTMRAVTGLGPLAVVDLMEITELTESPPTGVWRCTVAHTGRVVRGEGVFEVVALGPQRSRFLWTELLDLPLGALGRAGWPLARPAMRAGVALSLQRLARLTEATYRARRDR